jgi:hypothetical protein
MRELGSFPADVEQRLVEGSDLAEPALLVGFGETELGVGFDVVEERCLCRVEAEVGAADAGVFVDAGGAVGAEAVAERDAAELEVLLELGPFVGGDVAVFGGVA